MEGCANCVWIDYCQELMEIYQDGGEKARAEIERLISDPSLKMFLKMELNHKYFVFVVCCLVFDFFSFSLAEDDLFKSVVQ